jgi:hypothetical protein
VTGLSFISSQFTVSAGLSCREKIRTTAELLGRNVAEGGWVQDDLITKLATKNRAGDNALTQAHCNWTVAFELAALF